MFWTAAPLLVFIYLLVSTGTTCGHEHGPGVVRVVEGRDAILPCSLSTKENIVQKLFDWKKDGQKEVFLYDAGIHYNNGRTGQDEQFKGRVSHFREQLKYEQIFHIELLVELILKDRSGEKPGAAPVPSVRILNATEDGVLLQCVVQGASPKPKVEWQTSDGKRLPAEEPHVSERGGRYDVTLLTTVTKATSNYFCCVATQEEFGHEIKDEVYVPEKLFESCQVAGVFIGGWFSGVLTLAAALTVFVAAKYMTKRWGKSSGPQRNNSPSEQPFNV
ncbi:butyrophilin subfamily 3 member A2-like isoform X1 [Lates japonicus]|uniref:Butyrophilin subfamily 3 member A2-like isoform X1 n=1 Tax=Lates japonicus TaxID=270547 RepID=A0AAD3RFY7_LATJO|nr:butyrophilin subfamily 3 member A2-like isoform X1 [Lates japonicus]